MEVQRKRAKVKKKKTKPLDGNVTARIKLCTYFIRFTGTGYVNVEIAKENVSDKVSYTKSNGKRIERSCFIRLLLGAMHVNNVNASFCNFLSVFHHLCCVGIVTRSVAGYYTV